MDSHQNHNESSAHRLPESRQPQPEEAAAQEAETLSYRDKQIVSEQSSFRLRLDNRDNGQDKTVISQRPVAAPHEFYKSVPLGELAEMLEGRYLDHFIVQQIIGGGGMGAVFRGMDQRLDRVVAIKVIPGSRRDPETLRRFRVEAQAAARLDHPNIARVFYVGEAEQWNYIVFEYVDGINIRDLVEMNGPMTIDDSVFYARQIAEALQHAHDRDVVHRDIKPSNIVVTPTGMAKLVDMGLARDTSLEKSTGDQTASGVTLGTFDYISPEQARNPRDADVRSDLYSLGCTLFYMLTGNPPFPEGTALQKLLNHGSLPPPDPRGWRDDISDQLYDIMMKLMAKRPIDRYQKPVELVNDLLLLAELENLPRSQGPSTITLSPSISQPTLLETHLPWLVATTVLLGSTLWLHSEMSLSSGFAFPPINLPKAGAARAVEFGQSATVPVPALPDTKPILGNPATSGSSDPATLDGKSATLPPAVMDALSLRGSLQNLTTENGVTTAVDVASKTTNTMMPTASADAEATSTNYLQTTGGLIVVSSSQPLDVSEDDWENSLQRAIEKMSLRPGAKTIEIRGNIIVDSPLSISNFSGLTLRGFDASSGLEISRSAWTSTNASNSALAIVNSKLVIDSLKLTVQFPDSQRTSAHVMQLSSNASLVANSVQFTTRGEKANSRSLISVGGLAAFENQRGGLAATISLNNCLVRGQGSLLSVNSASSPALASSQISLTQCVVAVNGWVVELLSDTNVMGVDRIMRFFCDRSTFVSSAGFAKLDYSGSGRPSTGLNRTSNACVFWSDVDNPHIQILGGSGTPSSNPDQLLLQGSDNAYDQNVELLCVASNNNGRISQWTTHNGQAEGWYDERSTERRIPWKSPPQSLTNLTEITPEELQLNSSFFVPGYRTQIFQYP